MLPVKKTPPFGPNVNRWDLTFECYSSSGNKKQGTHKLMTYSWDIPLITFHSGVNVQCLNCLSCPHLEPPLLPVCVCVCVVLWRGHRNFLLHAETSHKSKQNKDEVIHLSPWWGGGGHFGAGTFCICNL